jgi:hypothetical protein
MIHKESLINVLAVGLFFIGVPSAQTAQQECLDIGEIVIRYHGAICR